MSRENTLDPDITRRQQEAEELAKIARNAAVAASNTRRHRLEIAYGGQPQQEITPDASTTTQSE